MKGQNRDKLQAFTASFGHIYLTYASDQKEKSPCINCIDRPHVRWWAVGRGLGASTMLVPVSASLSVGKGALIQMGKHIDRSVFAR